MDEYSMRERWFERKSIWDERPLFRGKDRDGKWIVGWFVFIPNPFGDSKVAAIVPPCDIYRRIEVDPDTVTHYVGCPDLDNNMIFDGDIVETCNGDVALVEFSIGHGAFLRQGTCGYRFPYYTAGDTADCRVVGNIFDNPEMLDQIQEDAERRYEKWRTEYTRELILTERNANEEEEE